MHNTGSGVCFSGPVQRGQRVAVASLLSAIISSSLLNLVFSLVICFADVSIGDTGLSLCD